MTDKDKKIIQDMLEELDTAYQKGKIDDQSYQEIRAQYLQKLHHFSGDSADNFAEISISGTRSVTSDTIKFSGSADIQGGKLSKHIKVSGSAKFRDNIECNSIRCSGSVRAYGNILAHGEVHSSGSFRCQGNLTADEKLHFSSSTHVDGNITSNGSLTCSGSLVCGGYANIRDGIKVSGSARFGGDVFSNARIKASGSFRAGGGVYVENDVHFSGSGVIGGDIIAKNKVEASGKLTVGENIVGRYVYIIQKQGLMARKLLNKGPRSIVSGSIYGREKLEVNSIHVEQDLVGREIIIGPNSEIGGTVFYVDLLEVDPGIELCNAPVKITVDTLNQQFAPIDKNSAETREKGPTKRTGSPGGDNPNYCSSCGAEVSTYMKYCPICGAAMDR